MISFKVLLRSFIALLIPILLHGILNVSIWHLNELALLSKTYSALYFTSISIVLFLQVSYRDKKGKSVLVFLGLTLLKFLFLIGYMYPLVKGLDLNYIYHLLALATCMLFIELALLSKTLRLA